MRRRVGVLGTFVWDRIWTLEDAARGVPFEGWGGIAYSLAAAAAALPPGWEVVPLVKLGADLAAEARAFLATLPGVVQDAGTTPVVPEPNNRVELRYTDRARRGERLTGGVPAWSFAELEPHLGGLDALFVNFISGFELELADAERLRARFGGPLYADLHSLFLGCPGAGARPLRRLPEWERWAGCFDAVQLNEDELRMTAPDGALTGGEAGAARLLRCGPGLVALTLGAEGASLAACRDLPDDPLQWPRWRACRPTRPAPTHARFPATPATGDPTGAGDVWGATFFLRLLAGDGPEGAVRRAHSAAARKLAVRGTAALLGHLRAGVAAP